MSEHWDVEPNPKCLTEGEVSRRQFLTLSGLLAGGLAAGTLLKAGGPLLSGLGAGRTSSQAALTTTNGSSTNRAVASLLLEAFNTGNTSVVDSLFHPSLAAHGERLKQEIQQLRAAFPDARFAESSLVAEGNLIIMRWIMTGTNSGRWLNRAATGKQVAAVGHEVIRLAAGRIVEHTTGLADSRWMMLRQLGWLDPGMVKQLA